jgi:hypothetical protein
MMYNHSAVRSVFPERGGPGGNSTFTRLYSQVAPSGGLNVQSEARFKIHGEGQRLLESFQDFGGKPANSSVQDARLAEIPILERWLLIHDREREAAAVTLRMDCLSAGW